MVPVIFGTAGGWLGYRSITQNRLGDRSNKVAIKAITLGALAAVTSVAMYVATS